MIDLYSTAGCIWDRICTDDYNGATELLNQAYWKLGIVNFRLVVEQVKKILDSHELNHIRIEVEIDRIGDVTSVLIEWLDLGFDERLSSHTRLELFLSATHYRSRQVNVIAHSIYQQLNSEHAFIRVGKEFKSLSKQDADTFNRVVALLERFAREDNNCSFQLVAERDQNGEVNSITIGKIGIREVFTEIFSKNGVDCRRLFYAADGLQAPGSRPSSFASVWSKTAKVGMITATTQ